MSVDRTISMSSLSVQETLCLVKKKDDHFASDLVSNFILISGSDEGPWNHSFRFEQ